MLALGGHWVASRDLHAVSLLPWVTPARTGLMPQLLYPSAEAKQAEEIPSVAVRFEMFASFYY